MSLATIVLIAIIALVVYRKKILPKRKAEEARRLEANTVAKRQAEREERRIREEAYRNAAAKKSTELDNQIAETLKYHFPNTDDYYGQYNKLLDRALEFKMQDLNIDSPYASENMSPYEAKLAALCEFNDKTEENEDILQSAEHGIDGADKFLHEPIKVVGTSFYDGKSILRNVVKDLGGVWDVGGWNEHPIDIVLIPEPNNPKDKNAIAVWIDYPTPERARVERKGQIGFVPATFAKSITISRALRIPATVLEGFEKFSVSFTRAAMIEAAESASLDGKDLEEVV